MAKQLKGYTHKKDIKLICPIRNLGSAVTVHGFETYERDTDSNGKPVKRLIPNVAVQFLPGPENVEDGFTVAYVSRTENNLKVIKELMEAGVVACDDPNVESLIEASDKDVARTEPGVVEGEGDRLMEKTKAELLTIAEQSGITVDLTWSKKKIVEALASKQEG